MVLIGKLSQTLFGALNCVLNGKSRPFTTTIKRILPKFRNRVKVLLGVLLVDLETVGVPVLELYFAFVANSFFYSATFAI